MIFNNRRFFKRQTIQILTSGIKIQKKTIFDSIEHEISFEKIDSKKKIITSVNSGLLFTAFFFVATGILFLLSGNTDVATLFFLIALIFMITAFLLKLKVVILTAYDGNNIELYFTRRNKASVVEFAEQIIGSVNSFLLTKYGKIDKSLPIENQLNNLEYLRNREIISEEVFESLKNKLLGRDNKSSIGFSN